MKIRKAEIKDIARIGYLLHQVNDVHADGRSDLFIHGKRKYNDDELVDIITNEKMLIYVAEEDMVLGYCFCIIEEAKGDNLHPIKSLFIDDLCVDENVRSTGIGTALYRYVVEEAKKLQCNRITLNVWCLNTSAMKFYEKMGLQPLKIVMEERL